MILQDLYSLYELKRQSDPTAIPPVNWCIRNVMYEIVLRIDGAVVSCIPLIGANEKQGRALVVPMAYVSRSGIKPLPGFLCDDAQHVFGIGNSNYKAELRDMHVLLHKRILDNCDDVGAKAYLSFLLSGETDYLPEQCEVLADDYKSNVVFRLENNRVYIHERQNVKNAWQLYCKEKEEEDPVWCLVTGKRAPRGKLFPQVTGLPGAQSAGASLVSSNVSSFVSYGQGATGSISKEAAEKAGAALAYVLKDRQHHVSLAGDHVAFWTEATTPVADSFAAFLFDFGDEVKASAFLDVSEDSTVNDAVKDTLIKLRNGKSIAPVPESTPYHALGIAPYQARLAVRFYETGTLGELQKNVSQFLQDTEMIGSTPCSLRTYLDQIAAQGDSSNVPSSLVTATVRALMRGGPFPAALEEQLLLRMRADGGTRNPWDMKRRAALLKAILVRKARYGSQRGSEGPERSIEVALNRQNLNEGYLLGRLFALLEKVQQDAIGGANATIRDRYMGAAATTPARVFPQLLNLAQHHISKSEYGERINRQIQEVVGLMDDSGFPKTLSYDDQGMFYIGYYQQRQALYTKVVHGSATDDQVNEEE